MNHGKNNVGCDFLLLLTSFIKKNDLRFFVVRRLLPTPDVEREQSWVSVSWRLFGFHAPENVGTIIKLCAIAICLSVLHSYIFTR